jgi:hypothetical protein
MELYVTADSGNGAPIYVLPTNGSTYNVLVVGSLEPGVLPLSPPETTVPSICVTAQSDPSHDICISSDSSISDICVTSSISSISNPGP